MATKYKDYYQRMLETNKELFDEFQKVHDQYALNPKALQERFNKEGEKIRTVIREWENKLCMQSEKAGYAGYTARLSEKFQDEVRKHFPQIDSVGLITNTNNKRQGAFFLKKINLH